MRHRCESRSLCRPECRGRGKRCGWEFWKRRFDCWLYQSWKSLLFKFIWLRQSRPDGERKKVPRSQGEAQRAMRKIGGNLQGEPIFCLRGPAGTLSQAIKKGAWRNRKKHSRRLPE